GEVVAGAAPLSSQDGHFDEAPEWEWSVEANQHSVTGLWNVTVRVRRPDQGGAEVALSQIVLDPSKRGNTMDAAAVAGSDASSTDSSSPGQSGSTPTQPSTGASTPAGGSTGKPATGGTTAPASGGT